MSRKEMSDSAVDNSDAYSVSWHKSPLGLYVQAQEQALFDASVTDIFGFNAIQMGMLHMDLLETSRIPLNIHASNDEGDVYCDSTQLPFPAGSIDLMLLPHGLDFSINPQQTLREAERILVPEGYLLLTGFNPLSFWGVMRMIKSRQTYPWRGNFYSLLRIKDWLALLGFEVISVRTVCYAPVFQNKRWLNRFAWMERLGKRVLPLMGGVYFIVAQKKIVGMRLIRPQWQKAKFKPRLVTTSTQKEDLHR
jgi:SAM-dependent methyltransferase